MALVYTQLTLYRGASIYQVYTGQFLHACNLEVTVYNPRDYFPFRATISKRRTSLLVPQVRRVDRQTDKTIEWFMIQHCDIKRRLSCTM